MRNPSFPIVFLDIDTKESMEFESRGLAAKHFKVGSAEICRRITKDINVPKIFRRKYFVTDKDSEIKLTKEIEARIRKHNPAGRPHLVYDLNTKKFELFPSMYQFTKPFEKNVIWLFRDRIKKNSLIPVLNYIVKRVGDPENTEKDKETILKAATEFLAQTA